MDIALLSRLVGGGKAEFQSLPCSFKISMIGGVNS